MNCPHCNATFTEDYNFCPSCEQQVLCLSCGKTIVPGKTKCLYCGTALGSGGQQQTLLNTFSLEESHSQAERTRKVSLSFSDNAINNATPILSAYAPLSRMASSPNTGNLLPSPVDANVNQADLGSQVIDYKTVTSSRTIAVPQDSSMESGKRQASDFFEIDSKGLLVPHTTDYKGTSKQSQQQRFAVLYTAAYQRLVGSPVPNRTHLNTAAKQSRLYDSNFPNNVSKIIKKYLTDTDGQLKLTPSGKDFVATIIEEMENEETVGHQVRSSRPTSKRTRVNKASRSEAEQWLEKPSALGEFDTRTIKATLDWCLFALQDITKVIKVRETVIPAVAYEYLTRRYQKVPIKRESFVRAFTRSYNRKYLEQSADGGYFLTSAGETYISELLSGSRVSTQS